LWTNILSYAFSCSIIVGVYVSGLENTPVPVGLKVWKTIPFVEDTLVSGTDALKLIS
jgi:hypothetical protein